MSKWKRLLRQMGRRIWFRAGLFSVLSVTLALLATVLAPFVPYQLSTKIGADAVDNILEILASSMLAVATFSMSTMVAAYAGAASNITPRATRLLIEDATAQNALSTFIGAFLFAIVGLCALATGAYGANGRVILFMGTIGVIAFIVFTLLRWIEHLSHFGRMIETIERVERAACRAALTLDHPPYLGVAPDPPCEPGVATIPAHAIGYITHLDVPGLAKIAGRQGLKIHVAAPPGVLAVPGRPLAWVEGAPTPAALRSLADAFTIEDSRQFDNDPRFGLVVLSEIASRALSPAVNDPGSAIAVVGAGLRVLRVLMARPPGGGRVLYPEVQVPGLSLKDLLEDFFRPIARDGAALIEVGLQVQKALGALKALAPEASDLIRYCANDALNRAQAGLSSDADRLALRQIHARYWS
jgi:uncharacterized membrane protein